MLTTVGIIADSYKAPAGGGWTPANLGALLKIWLDASDPATITASGGAVSEWRDKSGGAIHFVQATGANQPITGTRTINGRNTVDFAGTTLYSHMTGPTFTLAQPFTIAAVAQTDIVTSPVVRLIGRGNASVVNFARGTANAVLNCGTQILTAGWETTGPHCQIALVNGATSELRLDAGSTSGNAGTFGFSGIPFLGSITSATGAWDGPIAEVIIADTVLSGADLTSLGTYLKTKWGTP